MSVHQYASEAEWVTDHHVPAPGNLVAAHLGYPLLELRGRLVREREPPLGLVRREAAVLLGLLPWGRLGHEARE